MDREIRSLTGAMVLLDEYIAAYEELLVDHARLMRKFISQHADLAHAHAALANDLWLAEQLEKPPESECPF